MYVPPVIDGVAVRTADSPAQTDALSTVTTGMGFALTLPDARFEAHPLGVV